MQEAVLDMSERLNESITSSLANVLGPAVEKLVSASSDLSNRQANSSEEVLRSLVGTFVDRVGAQADQQRELMASASAEMKTVTAQLTDSFQGFLVKMEDQLGSMRDTQSLLLEKVSGTVQTHVQETSRLVNQGETLASKISDMGESLASIGEDLRGSSDSMRQSAALLDRTTKQIQVALQQFSDVLSASTRSTQTYVDETRNLVTVINDALSFLGEFEGQTQKTNESLRAIVGTVDTGLKRLEQNQERFLVGMQGNLEAVQKQVAELLKDYGDQVQAQTIERMDTWNQQTREFSQQMVNAVNSMHETLSEVEDMVAQLRRR